MTNKTFDIVVWGATGFTGRLVTEYLFKTYGTDGDLKWAVAGRNPAKLTQLNQDIADNTLPQIIADSADEASLRELVASTRAVCTTVGPYALYGTKLVALCAELGTHYCDLTGETPWMRQIIDDYGANAEKSGACIATACDFRIGAEGCFMQYPEIDIGVNLQWKSLPLITHLVGPARAKRLVAGGERIHAGTLLTWGILDELVSRDELTSAAQRLARVYVNKPPIAVQMIKRSINTIMGALDQSIMHMDSDQTMLASTSTDQKEALRAYLAKTDPTFTGN